MTVYCYPQVYLFIYTLRLARAPSFLLCLGFLSRQKTQHVWNYSPYGNSDLITLGNIICIPYSRDTCLPCNAILLERPRMLLRHQTVSEHVCQSFCIICSAKSPCTPSWCCRSISWFPHMVACYRARAILVLGLILYCSGEPSYVRQYLSNLKIILGSAYFEEQTNNYLRSSVFFAQFVWVGTNHQFLAFCSQSPICALLHFQQSG